VRDDATFEDDGGLAEAFSDLVDAVTIGPSPMAAVMRDGRSLRHRRRAGVVAGMATLAVVPVAAVAAFGVTGSGKTALPPANATSAAKPTAHPTPTSAGPGPDDQIVTIAQGIAGGKHWVLLRDRFGIRSMPAGPPPPTVPTDSLAAQKHLPLSDVLSGKASAQCEIRALVFEGQDRDQALTHSGVGCAAVDRAVAAHDAAGLYDRPWSLVPDSFIGLTAIGPDSTDTTDTTDSTDTTRSPGVLIYGEVDASKVASVSITSDIYGNLPAQPVFRVGGERTGYFVWVLAGKLWPQHDQEYTLVVHCFDAGGNEIAHLDQGSDTRPKALPSSPIGTSSTTK
jgi:hypothetical protein